MKQNLIDTPKHSYFAFIFHRKYSIIDPFQTSQAWYTDVITGVSAGEIIRMGGADGDDSVGDVHIKTRVFSNLSHHLKQVHQGIGLKMKWLGREQPQTEESISLHEFY